jgi:adenylosuccinate synthase
MRDIKVVIGANFGDEGKGLMTDYFASKHEQGLVVRFCGGSQAGHTVVSPNGIRHIFSHFSSGLLANWQTYLSRYFIVNPFVFYKEYKELEKKGIHPVPLVDMCCLVTTPYDMLINQLVEEYRGVDKHGSCGLGINETINRSKEFAIKILDLYNESALRILLKNIKENYIFNRINELGIINIPQKYIDWLNNEDIINNYINMVQFMLKHIQSVTVDIIKYCNNVIFEGSQGLLLDQNNSEYFPNLTPSNTGMQNVREILLSIGWKNEPVDACYVTRHYCTRHGAGKLPNELKFKPNRKIIDLTNVPNPYQDSLRYALLDVNLLQSTINKDIKFTLDLNCNYNLAITCLDQAEPIDNDVYNDYKYICNNHTVITSERGLIQDICNFIKFKDIYKSYGMTRETIVKESRY